MVDVKRFDKNERPEWIFDDTFKESIICIFDKFVEDYVANSGKKMNVVFLDVEGKKKIILSTKLDYTRMVEAFDSETDKWTGKQAYLKKNEKGKYALYPLEESIKVKN
jgi:hypothetical protein